MKNAFIYITLCLTIISYALSGNSKITFRLFALPDSSQVIRYSAKLYNNGITIDSLSSNETNEITFENIPTVVNNHHISQTPQGYILLQNYPNPFNPSTNIPFSTPNHSHVSLKVYDLLGRTIATLIDDDLAAGAYSVNWSPTVATGIYFCQLRSGSFTKTIKLVSLEGNKGNGTSTFNSINVQWGDNLISSKYENLKKVQLGVSYELHIYNQEGITFPQIAGQPLTIANLTQDTVINIYRSRLVKKAVLNPLPSYSLTINDTAKVGKYIGMITGKGYDSNGLIVPDSMNSYVLLNQTDSTLVKVCLVGNVLKLEYLKPDAIGHSDVTVQMEAPNGQKDMKTFGIDVTLVRNISFDFTDFATGGKVDSFFVATTKDAKWMKNGETIRGASIVEHAIVNGFEHLRSGVFIPEGTNDTLITDYLMNADTIKGGLDTIYFKKLLTARMSNGYRNITPSWVDGRYTSFEPDVVPDTIWIPGVYEPIGNGFRTVEQLNVMGWLVNNTLRTLTETPHNPDGIFGINNQVIAILDSNFSHADSIAKFHYSNMKIVPPTLSADHRIYKDGNTIIIYAINGSFCGVGENNPIYENDFCTLKGLQILINKKCSADSLLAYVEKTFLSGMMGDIRFSVGYPSIYDDGHSQIFPQDIMRQRWVIFRGPGRQYPDLPKEF